MRIDTRAHLLNIVAAALFVSGCATDDETVLEDFSKDSDEAFFEAVPVLAGKFDARGGIRGPTTDADGSDTQVWAATRDWNDTDAAAGLAWPADSGLTWDEKYAAWVESLPKIDAEGYGETFELTTPHGRTLRAPKLECAEATVFLRVAFASWYGLPFYMTAWAEGSNLHFGHFGVWRDDFADGRFPRFRVSYADHTAAGPGATEADWPRDAKLARRKLTTSGDDANEWMGDDKYAGAYFDEIFLNKRVGHFLVFVLTYTGSIHLASTSNTFNLAPEAVRAGDTLLHRWQRRGIGHTMVVKHVAAIEDTELLEAELVSGSMPRRQPKWESPGSSKYSFTNNDGGGVGEDSDGNALAALGGWLKRWRVPVRVAGRWRNRVPTADEAHFISGGDLAAIAARPARFEALLGELTPELKRDTLVGRIEGYRVHLSEHPSSCSARIHREETFAELYALQAEHFGKNATETDLEYRTYADYVFAELDYTTSRTCCWNSTTAAMYELVMAFNETHRYDSETMTCNPPVVFRMVDGGYAPFEEYAEEQGRSDEWVTWSADESCPQEHTVQTDTLAETQPAPYCETFPNAE